MSLWMSKEAKEKSVNHSLARAVRELAEIVFVENRQTVRSIPTCLNVGIDNLFIGTSRLRKLFRDLCEIASCNVIETIRGKMRRDAKFQ